MEIVKRIKRLIKKSDNVFICSHKNLDLDAIGSCIGISSICNHFKKDNYIIIDDTTFEVGVNKILEEVKSNKKTITSEDISKYHKKKSLLIIVDVSKECLLQSDKILNQFKNIIVLDHHQEKDSIKAIKIISEKYSSASEIVASLMENFKVVPTELEATILLSGIVLDTNHYKVKTTSNTYYVSYFLSEYGADSKKVKYYLKEDLNDYIIRNKVIMNVEIINDKYALVKCDKKDKYKREDLAKIADVLLGFNNIEASFVVGERIESGIGISARSEGRVDVGSITSRLGGGGDTNSAACHIDNMKIDEVYSELKEILNKE